MVSLTEKKVCPLREDSKLVVLQSLLDTHRQPFFLVDRRYRIVAVNRAFANSFHVDVQDVVGQPCYRVSRNRDAPCKQAGGSCPLPDVMKPGVGTFPRACAGTVNGSGRSRFTAYQLQGEKGEVYLGELLLSQCFSKTR